MVETYFNSERTVGLTYTVVGILAIALAICGWRHDPFWRGMTLPLAAVAVVEVSVGITGWSRSLKDIQRVQHFVTQELERVAGEEVPRMQTALRKTRLARS